MAAIKNHNNLTPQEEVFAREVAYMMIGSDLKRLGVDVRYETYLYLAYKKAYPRTKATVASLQVMASRLYKKVKIRLRVEQLSEQFLASVVEQTSQTINTMLDQLFSLTPADYTIIDPETGTPRKRKEHELSVAAWWLVKKTTRYGYEKMTFTELADAIAKLKGLYKPQENVTTINTANGDEEIVLMFGGKKFSNDEKD